MKCAFPKNVNGQKTRCGNCMACRIHHAQMWSIRLMHEASYWKENCSFVTLTFSDEHLPENNSISKEELQNYIKRVRYHLGEKFPEIKQIKYFACGEYGQKSFRPHYHILFFGIHCRLRKFLYQCWMKCEPERFTSGTVTTKSINYVTGYIRKKLTGHAGKLKYEAAGLTPPFQLQSAGLGLRWAKENETMLKQKKHITLEGGKTQSIPRYYRKKLDIELDLSKMPEGEFDSFTFKDRGKQTDRMVKQKAEMFSKDKQLKGGVI